jgi:hypothetical protein
MQLKALSLFVVIAVGISIGCTSRRHVYMETESFVGDYVFVSADAGSPHDPDRLTLKDDGRYLLVHMPGGHEGLTEQGGWRMIDKPEPGIIFGNAMYPIKIDGDKILLLVNEDLGYRYQKAK